MDVPQPGWQGGGVSRIARTALLCALVLAGVTSTAGAAPRDPGLAAVRTFAFGIGDGALSGDVAARFRDYDLVVVDGEGVTAAQVRRLRRGGRIVLGYLSVGTVEDHRSWYPRARAHAMEPYADWPGERFADTSRAGFRTLIAGSVAPAMLRKGLDGLFLDNVDMVREHPAQRAGMFRLVRMLRARLDAGRHRYLFAQNGEDVIGPVLPALDGWNREDVSTVYDFDAHRYGLAAADDRRAAVAALRRIGRRGLLVTATDYTSDGTGNAVRVAVRTACGAGAVPFVSDIGLGRIPATGPRCSRK